MFNDQTFTVTGIESEVDDEEIAYLLRMGGIDAEIVEAGRG